MVSWVLPSWLDPVCPAGPWPVRPFMRTAQSLVATSMSRRVKSFAVSLQDRVTWLGPLRRIVEVLRHDDDAFGNSTMGVLRQVPFTRLGAECADLRRRFTGPTELPSSRIAASKPQLARLSPTRLT